MTRAAILLMLAATVLAAVEPVFQYRLVLPNADPKKPAREGLVWIPPATKTIRGALLSGMTLMERDMSRDAKVRAVCAEEGLAIVFMRSGLGDEVQVRQAMEQAAQVSGYEELAKAPMLFVGHSAGGPQAKALAISYAQRCFGLIQYRGGMPGGEPGVPAGIPCLAMVGQFDEFGGEMRTEDHREPAWMQPRADLLAWRTKDQGNLASIVVETGAGHFAWSERSATYLALFVKAAAQARLGEGPDLKAIDVKSGWLTDLDLTNPQAAKPAPVGSYAGDPAKAAWHPTEALAKATVAQHTTLSGRKDQFIRWNDGFWIDAGVRYFFTGLTWVDDGMTFQVHPVYADKIPTQPNGQGPKWPGAGGPCGHSAAPITVRPVSGPLVAVAADKLRIRYDATFPATGGANGVFMAVSEGDQEYRYTEHIGMTPRGYRGLGKGQDQTITFPELADLKVSSAPVELAAESSAKLPVEYYVAYGPAVIENGNRLVVTEVPARATYPIEIGVMAWQFGRGIAPEVKTATPILRTCKLLAP